MDRNDRMRLVRAGLFEFPLSYWRTYRANTVFAIHAERARGPVSPEVREFQDLCIRWLDGVIAEMEAVHDRA